MSEIVVSRDLYVCELSSETPAAIEVQPGSVVRLCCREACDRGTGPGPDRAPAANPSTGPVAVAGAAPGAALRVEVLDVVPVEFGHIGDGEGGYREIRIVDGAAAFSDELRVPIRPMIGVLGVALPEGSWDATGCGLFESAGAGKAKRVLVGGNMDTNDVAPGAVVYLPVCVPGGMLVAGDVHAVMGDGEIGGQGLEVAADVTLRLDVEPSPLCPSAYLYRDDQLMVLGAGASLDDACRMATLTTMLVLMRELGLSEHDAGKLLGFCADVRIGEVCCPIKTARVAVPLSVVPQLRRPN